MPYISKKQLKTLRQVRSVLTMESAGFGKAIDEHVLLCDGEGNPIRGATPIKAAEYVRDRTRLWRDTWVLGPLDAIIADLEKDL